MKLLPLLLLLFCSFLFAQGQSSATPKKSNPENSLYILKTGMTDDNMPIDTSPVYLKYKEPEKEVVTETLLPDSSLIDHHYLNYLDPNEISSIDVLKNTRYPKGAIYIKFKDHDLLLKLLHSKLLSLSDIEETYSGKADKHKPTIYLLDKKLLTDTANVRIPEICLAHVTIAQASEMPYFKTAMPGVLVMMITTKPASTKPYRPMVMIRGSENK